MDLHFTNARPTTAEREAVDSVAENFEADSGGHAARERRHLLLPALQAIAQRVGWISEGALNYAGRVLSVPPADAYGVATFYALLPTTPQPPATLHVCDDIACMMAGSEPICRSLDDVVGPGGEPSDDGRALWKRSPCLGLCDRAPAAFLTIAGRAPVAAAMAPIDARTAVETIAGDGLVSKQEAPAPHIGGAPLRLLQRVGNVDPESLDDYRRQGGYRALRRAFELGPERVVEEVVNSNLLGRGGAAFPTGRKMQAVALARSRPHYLVCNADESEPGTFKDRILMEHDPFAIVEAMTIAAFGTGCERGFLYVRGEYPLSAKRLTHAMATARSAGLLGDNILSSGFSFDIEMRRGAGAYICGEETALFNSIEGKRGEPRNKPPFPVASGLFGQPTLVNNVETLVNLPAIVLEGGKAYASIGTPDSTGTRLFCVSGSIRQPGLYEIAQGTTLGALLEMAGGQRCADSTQAILLGGAAGVFIRPTALSMPLSFEGARAANATLGSGVVMVFDDRIDIKRVLLRIARFFRDESCGQCVPCRVGTVRQEEALERLTEGVNASRTSDLALLGEIAQAMRDASICGLGQTAANAIASAQTALGLFSTDGRP